MRQFLAQDIHLTEPRTGVLIFALLRRLVTATRWKAGLAVEAEYGRGGTVG
jgi:uncharacterized membrane protein